MKTSWVTVSSAVVFALAGGIAHVFPNTFAGQIAEVLVFVFGALGHFAAPLVQTEGK